MSNIDLPDQSGEDIEVHYTDSGKIQLIIKTPELERYLSHEQPYSNFPKGIHVLSYNKQGELESTIDAGFARYDETTKVWEARDNVIARNVITGEQLNTEQLFWDQEKKIIFSRVFTKITNEDGVYFGEQGFEADQDFSHYKLIGSSGTVKVKNEEEL